MFHNVVFGWKINKKKIKSKDFEDLAEENIKVRLILMKDKA
jgi:hypothetical protein